MKHNTHNAILTMGQLWIYMYSHTTMAKTGPLNPHIIQAGSWQPLLAASSNGEGSGTPNHKHSCTSPDYPLLPFSKSLLTRKYLVLNLKPLLIYLHRVETLVFFCGHLSTVFTTNYEPSSHSLLQSPSIRLLLIRVWWKWTVGKAVPQNNALMAVLATHARKATTMVLLLIMWLSHIQQKYRLRFRKQNTHNHPKQSWH